MSEAYAAVIDIIAKDAVNWRAVGLEIAKADPDKFLEACGKCATPAAEPREPAGAFSATTFQVNVNGLHTIVGSLLDAGKKVEAIKMRRMLTGWGLKEAKDWVDHLEKTRDMPIASFDRSSLLASAFSPEAMKLSKQLKDVLSPDVPATASEGLNWSDD